MKKAFLFIVISFLVFQIYAQKGVVKGTVRDAVTGELLIGVNIVYAPGQGTITDIDGNYSLELSYEEYNFEVSYIGYEKQTRTVNVNSKVVYENYQLKIHTLREVEVVADMAKTRETPVAFSNITPIQIQEELASQDIPMILNSTPGVYATQQGGGDGDARINIRGFNQRNIAVMIDGIPVNDMENGWVYWSNWFGLDMVTRNIQVQRGLGKSKLAIPSVGGTMNIISCGVESKMKISLKQEVGNDAFSRTSVGFSSGRLNNGWGVTFAGSYKRGDGWVDLTWTRGWFYFLRVDKQLGKHLISLIAMGAPQKHTHRSYKKSIATFDKKYAAKLGVDTTGVNSYGIRYNPNWGYLQRAGEDREQLPQRLNYYHKPQISLRDFWNVNDKLYISNILYTSIGKGGGTSTATSDKYGTPGSSSFPEDPETGQIDFQTYYDKNYYSEDKRSRGILRSSINNHYWFGLLSTFTYEMNEEITFSGGVDLRSYKGEHYMEVYDLLGGNYFLDNTNKNAGDIVRYEGDKIRYYDDGLVRWGGLFGQMEYNRGNLTAFFNVSAAYSGYKRIDYFIKKELDVNDTTLRIGYNDTIVYHDISYTRNSPGLKFADTDWKWFPGYTIKGGANYNLSEKSNIYANIGYLSKAPRFNNVFYYENVEFTDPKNEIVRAVELGYGYYNPKLTLNVNAYLTDWMNKPADRPTTYVDPVTDEIYRININGMSALHMGIEIEFAHKLGDKILWERLLSIGDWRWKSEDTARVYINEQIAKKIYFNAKDVHVGDAAQIQYAERIKWEIIKDLYLKGVFTFFGKNYSQFDPFSLSPSINPNYLDSEGNPRDSWEMPSFFLIDLHAGYRFKFDNFDIKLRASVLNLLDQQYISDAQNNDSYSSGYNDFDAKSAGVWFGLGRRFNVSVMITLFN